MKKYLNLLYLVFLIALTSFDYPNKNQSKTLHIFYVDNSETNNYENFGPQVFEKLTTLVNSANNEANSGIDFFLSNGIKTEFASNYTGSRNLIERMQSGLTDVPNSFHDRSAIIDNLMKTDLSDVDHVNMYLFLTEYSLKQNFMSGSFSGFFINTLPREIQSLISLSDEEINITIYYPAGSTKIKENDMKAFIKFPNIRAEFFSNIKFNFVAL